MNNMVPISAEMSWHSLLDAVSAGSKTVPTEELSAFQAGRLRAIAMRIAQRLTEGKGENDA